MKKQSELICELHLLFNSLGLDPAYYIKHLYLIAKKNSKKKSNSKVMQEGHSLIRYGHKCLSFSRVRDYGYYIRDNDTATNYYLFS